MNKNVPLSGGFGNKKVFARTTFESLEDTFLFAGNKNKFAVVNTAETALEAIDLPPIAITDTFVVASEAAMLSLTCEIGDVAIRTDINQSFILQVAGPTVLAHWVMLLVAPTHAIGGPLHTSDTIANVNTKLSDGDMITTLPAEINALTSKASPTTSDLLMIEDAADTNKKKKITIASFPAVAPALHASTHNSGGADVMAINAAAATGSLRTLGTSATSAAAGDDSRFLNVGAIVEPGGTVTNVQYYYGTGSPPAAAGKPNGTLFFKYTP